MKENKTKYIELYETLRDDILKGRYIKGDKLPSKRVTAEKYGLSVITVEHAYELLLEEGYISSKEKSGFSFDFGALGPNFVTAQQFLLTAGFSSLPLRRQATARRAGDRIPGD